MRDREPRTGLTFATVLWCAAFGVSFVYLIELSFRVV
jgi:hypothetical protein